MGLISKPDMRASAVLWTIMLSMKKNRLWQLTFMYILLVWFWLFSEYAFLGKIKYIQLYNQTNAECPVGDVMVL